MNHETALWTLLACLLAAAVIGFAVAWIVQMWRMREGTRLAADLEAAHTRLQAADHHLTVAAEHERAARVQADQRTRDLNDELLALRAQQEETAQTHQRQLARLDNQLARAAEERDHLQQAAHQLTEHAALLDRLQQDLTRVTAERDAALAAAGQADAARACAEASLNDTGANASSAAIAAAEARTRLAALSSEHAEGQRELLQLRTRLGAASNRTLELEHTINRMQLEALSQAQAHAQALAAVQAASAQPAANDAEDQRIAQRLDAQRLQELEDQLRRSRQLASDYKLEAAGLKNRVTDLELRLTQVFAEQQSAPADDSLTENKDG